MDARQCLQCSCGRTHRPPKGSACRKPCFDLMNFLWFRKAPALNIPPPHPSPEPDFGFWEVFEVWSLFLHVLWEWEREWHLWEMCNNQPPGKNSPGFVASASLCDVNIPATVSFKVQRWFHWELARVCSRPPWWSTLALQVQLMEITSRTEITVECGKIIRRVINFECLSSLFLKAFLKLKVI